jgi:hypothetical protein
VVKKFKIWPFLKQLKTASGSGAPSSNDPKFKRRPPGAPWPTFDKSNDAKLLLLSILKALESLETFRSGLSLIARKTGPLDDIGDYQEDSY